MGAVDAVWAVLEPIAIHTYDWSFLWAMLCGSKSTSKADHVTPASVWRARVRGRKWVLRNEIASSTGTWPSG